MNYRMIHFVVILMTAVALQAQHVNITGTVTSSVTGEPVAGATVSLTNRSLSVQSGSDGRYALVSDATGASVGTAGAGGAALRLAVSGAVVVLSKAVRQVRIAVFDVAGRALYEAVERELSAGVHTLPLPQTVLSPRMYLIEFTADGVTRRTRCIPADGGAVHARMDSDAADRRNNRGVAAAMAKQLVVVDTLRVEMTGYKSAYVPIQSYTGVHHIVLDTVLARLVVFVVEDSTYLEVPNANVVVYSAGTNDAVARRFTDAMGECTFFLTPHLSCWVRASAHNYRSNPALHGLGRMLTLGDSGTVVYEYMVLKRDSSCTDCGAVSGRVEFEDGRPVAGALVVAIRESDSITVNGYTASDGMYALYNVPRGVYELQSWKAGLVQTAPVRPVPVDSQVETRDVIIRMTSVSGAALSGRVTFLASPNSEVDVVLAHPLSFEAIPGLNTVTVSQNYAIASIPPGTYIPWASYYNDGYVMDPDWIRKFGLPVLTVRANSGPQTLNFSVTGAIGIISPTNAPDTLVPREIDTDQPTFVWRSYPSTQEFIIAVYDNYGDIIWGGYDAAGNIMHARIDGRQTSVRFNFDGSAREPIRAGRQYRWKVWADKGAQPGVQQLISASEDLMGMFLLSDS